MIQLRKSHDRGFFNHGWLKTYHSFSFADYFDPNQMGFGVLRVINEDVIAASQGFSTHRHHDMEIITYIISGALEHKDSMGNTSIIRPGEVQRMSAGTGVMHSEFNPLADQETHLLQIWILPDKKAYRPSYQQKAFIHEIQQGGLILVASQVGCENSISLHQDVSLYIGKLAVAEQKIYIIQANRKVWIQLVHGVLQVNDIKMLAGDGAAIENEITFTMEALQDTEFLLFDLPDGEKI